MPADRAEYQSIDVGAEGLTLPFGGLRLVRPTVSTSNTTGGRGIEYACDTWHAAAHKLTNARGRARADQEQDSSLPAARLTIHLPS